MEITSLFTCILSKFAKIRNEVKDVASFLFVKMGSSFIKEILYFMV